MVFLFAQPDPRHIVLPDKVRFLTDWQSRLKSSEQGFSAAQEFLQTQDLSVSDITLSEFAGKFA